MLATRDRRARAKLLGVSTRRAVTLAAGAALAACDPPRRAPASLVGRGSIALRGATEIAARSDGARAFRCAELSMDLGANRCADGTSTGLSFFDGTAHHVVFATGADAVAYTVEPAARDATPRATLPVDDACSLTAADSVRAWAFARPNEPIEVVVCDGMSLR